MPQSFSTLCHRAVGWLPLVTLVLFALFVRGGVLLAMPEGLATDTDGYRRLARSLRRHGTYSFRPGWGAEWCDAALVPDDPDLVPWIPTAYRPPLYPLMLSRIGRGGNVSSVQIGLLHVVLGMATVLLTFRVAQAWGLKSGAYVSALLVACDPILLNQSTQIMTETLATLLSVAALYALSRFSRSATPFRAMISGSALALCVLCRPTFLLWLALVLIFIPLTRLSWTRRALNSTAILGGVAALLVPWVVRNQMEIGRPIVTTTHGGYTLLLGNNPHFYEYLQNGTWGTAWHLNEHHSGVGEFQFTFRSLPVLVDPAHSEILLDRVAYQRAFRNIRAQPGMFLHACLFRLRRLWGILPYQTDPNETVARRVMRYAAAGWYAGVLVLAGVGAWGLGRQLWRMPWLWGALLCLSFTVVHTFYWTDLRMRAPLMPVIAMVAAAGAAWLLADRERRKTLFNNDFHTHHTP